MPSRRFHNFQQPSGNAGHETSFSGSFDDTPVGRGAKTGNRFGVYSDEDLRKGRATGEYAVPHGQQKTKTAAVYAPQVRIVRPFARRELADQISNAREHVAGMLSRLGIATVDLDPQEAEGAVLLSGSTLRHAAIHSSRIRQLPATNFIETVRQHQPASYTEVIASSGSLAFLGTGLNKKVVALALDSPDMQAEREGIVAAVDEATRGEAIITNYMPVVPLTMTAAAKLTLSVQAKFRTELNPLVESLGIMEFAPSPALTADAPQPPANPAQ